MNSDEKLLREQLATTEELAARWPKVFAAQQKRLEEVTRLLEPVLAIASAYQHLPDRTVIVSRQSFAKDGWKTANLEVRHTNALLAWANEDGK